MSRREPLITKPDSPDEDAAAPERPRHGPGRMSHGPMAQNVAEKAINFGPSLRRADGLMGNLHLCSGSCAKLPALWHQLPGGGGRILRRFGKIKWELGKNL